MIRALYITLLFAVYTQWVYAQDINLRFQHITSEQGLSQNKIDCIMQDSRGFMWFGTWNGLNRNDGYNFLIFKSENKEEGLSNNFIYTLFEYKNGDIWTGTKNGLNQIDHHTNTIETYYHNPRGLIFI